jgi:hypothetical protein
MSHTTYETLTERTTDTGAYLVDVGDVIYRDPLDGKYVTRYLAVLLDDWHPSEPKTYWHPGVPADWEHVEIWAIDDEALDGEACWYEVPITTALEHIVNRAKDEADSMATADANAAVWSAWGE